MKVFLWIWRLIAPIVVLVGALAFGDDSAVEPGIAAILGAITAVIGIAIGFTGWAEEVPPRLFWIKGNVDLLDNKIGYALKLGIQMFFLPACIMALISLI